MFRDGPSGRRAALASGPDMWEIAAALRGAASRGAAAVETVAAELTLPTNQVRTALVYYGAYSEEIDAATADNERAADESLRSWEAQQRLLA